MALTFAQVRQLATHAALLILSLTGIVSSMAVTHPLLIVHWGRHSLQLTHALARRARLPHSHRLQIAALVALVVLEVARALPVMRAALLALAQRRRMLML